MTETKLARYCDKVIEAGWLAALVAVPLFFNIYSSRVFEPDKLTLLRSIVIAMIAAWIVGKAETLRLGGRDTERDAAQPGLWARIRSTPLVLPTLLMVLAYLISLAFSRTPGISWKGSYVRLQGVSAAFSYIVIFFLMLERMRTRDQLERAVQTVILTSVPASLYGILQHYRLDPLPWAGETAERVASSMGNAIFIAAWLLMAFFVTLYKALPIFGRMATSKEQSPIRDAVLGGVYLFILAIQLVAIFFTQSRGPWLGLLGGLYAFVLILLVSLRQRAGGERRMGTGDVVRGLAAGAGVMLLGGALAWVSIARLNSPLLGVALLGTVVILSYVVLILSRAGWRWLWISWIAQTILVAAFLVVFNLPQTPLESLRETPYIGRLGQVFETEGGTGKVRVLIWEGAVKMIASNPLRALVGYGPESMYVTYEPFYPPDLAHYEARNRTPDRSHNQTFDALVSTGILGFLAYMFLFSSIFYYGMRWLGLIRSPRERNLFVALIVGGAAVGTALARVLTGGYAFVGVSLPAGFIFGLVLYLIVAAVNPTGGEADALPAERRILIAALLAAILGHFIEIHFGFIIAATGTYFWALAALFALAGSGRIREVVQAAPSKPSVAAPPAPGRKHKQRKRPQPPRVSPQRAEDRRWREFLAYTLIVALVVSVVVFDFTSNQARAASIPAIIANSFTKIGLLTESPRGSWAMAMLLGLTVLTGAAMTFHRAREAEDTPPSAGWLVGAVVIFLCAVILIPLAVGWAKADLLRVGKDVSGIIARWYIAFFALMFALGAALFRPGPSPQRWARVEIAWAYAILAVAAGVIIWNANGVLVKADILYQQGYLLEQDYMKNAGALNNEQRLQVLDRVLGLYNSAIRNTPSEDFYYLAAARVLQQMVPLAQTPQKKQVLLNQGIATVEKARALYPLNVDHTANMGRFYRTWAQEVTDPAEKQEKLQLASDYYAQATQLSPNKAHLYNEWALVYYLMGDYDKAREKLEKSLSLDALYDQTYLLLGQLYTQTGDWANAEEVYRKAVDLNPTAVESLSMLGYVLDQQGKITEAITQNLRVLELAPQDYISIRNLSVLYNKLGDYKQALAYAQLALSLAPDSDKPQLEQFVEQLRALAGGQ